MLDGLITRLKEECSSWVEVTFRTPIVVQCLRILYTTRSQPEEEKKKEKEGRQCV